MDLAASPGNTIDQNFFIQNYRMLDRRRLLPYLEGRGLEIGPGHQPFVTHDHVTYLEKFPLDEWQSANTADNVDHSHWEQYQIGDANALPGTLTDLDFIFSSHVFEHLHNPLGHLEHWHERLKPGGHVVAIIPIISGAKDLRARPSALSMMIEQKGKGTFELTRDDYEMYRRVHALKTDADTMMAKQQSIHAHYFEENNTREMLEYACDKLGFSSYELRYEPNHKDLHFILRR